MLTRYRQRRHERNRIGDALMKLTSVTTEPTELVHRIRQAAMLEAAQVTEEQVLLICKVAARGRVTVDTIDQLLRSVDQ